MRLIAARRNRSNETYPTTLAAGLVVLLACVVARGQCTLTWSCTSPGGLSVNGDYALVTVVGSFAALDDSSTAQAPAPNPMEWATAPHATTSTAITMTAAVATGSGGTIQYFFENIDTTHNSGWMAGRTWTEYGLSPDTLYHFRVKARSTTYCLETAWSAALPARTEPEPNEVVPDGSAEHVSGELGNDLSLQVDPFTGSVGYTLPIALPPGRQGSEPSLALRYGGGGNGWCGVGWSLGMGAIQRDTRKGVPVARDGATFLNKYDDEKGFVVAFGAVNSRLVEVNDVTHEYRAETDQAFLKYTYDAMADPNGLWTVTDKSGNKFYFGRVTGEYPGRMAGAAMRHPQFTSAADGDNVYLWALAKIEDISGNLTYVYYTQDAGQLYLDEIRYNGHEHGPFGTTHCVQFVREDREDKSISYATGCRVETNKRLKEIQVKVFDKTHTPNAWVRVRSYHLTYETSPSTLRSLLTSVKMCGTGDPNDPNSCLPPVNFEYQQKPFEFERNAQGDPILRDWGPLNSQGLSSIEWGIPGRTEWWNEGTYPTGDVMLLDINNDGLPDRVMRNASTNPYNPSASPAGNVFKVQLNTGSGFSAELLDWGPVDALAQTTAPFWNSLTSATYDPGWIGWGLGCDATPSATSLMDINGDGFVDRVMHRYTVLDASYDPAQSLNYFHVQSGTGLGFARTTSGSGGGTDFTTYNWGPLYAQGFDPVTYAHAWNSVDASWKDEGYTIGRLSLLDMNGDGLPDRVMQGIDGMNYSSYTFNPASSRNLFRVQLNTRSGFERSGAGSGGGSDHITLDWGPLDAQGSISDSEVSHAWNALHASVNNSDFVAMIDINGDGLPDRVMREGVPNTSGDTTKYDVFRVQFNTGYGFERSSTTQGGGTGWVTRDWGTLNSQGYATNVYWSSINATVVDEQYAGQYVSMFDINGDGLPDRVMRSYGSPHNKFKVELNTGSGFTHQINGQDITWLGVSCQSGDSWFWGSPGATYTVTTGGGSADYSWEMVALCDINGDGLVDRVMREYDGNQGGSPSTYDVLKVQLNKGPIPDLLCKVNGALGGSVEVTYKPSTQYDNRDHNGIHRLGFPVQTASSLTVDDGLGHRSTTAYEYSRGFFDGQAREFRGFGKVKVTDPAGAMSITYFHQGGGYEDPNGGEFEDADSVAKKGMPYRVEVYGSDSKLYTVTTNKVEEAEITVGRSWHYAYVSQTTKLEYAGVAYESDSNDYPTTYRAKVRQSVYDIANKTGNILKSIDLGEVSLGTTAVAIATNIHDHTYTDPNTNDDLYIHTTYATISGHPEIMNKIAGTKTTSDAAGSTKLKEIVFTYDTLGRVQTEQTWLDKDRDGTVNEYTTASSYGYDAYGNRSYSIDKAGIRTDTTYDSYYHMFPVEKTTGTFVTSTDYDIRSGVPARTVDPAGLATENTYDEFFRLTDVMASTEPNSDPNLWLTHIEYNLGGIVDHVSYNYIHQKHTGYEAYTYNDGLGRVVQTRTVAEPNESIPNRVRAVASCYDERGNIEFQTLPFFADGNDFTPPYSYEVLLNATPSFDPSNSLGKTTATYLDASTLSLNTTYYWQVKKLGAGGQVLSTSDTWSFTTETQAESEWRDPENPASDTILSGVDYTYYDTHGRYYFKLPDFDTLVPDTQGAGTNFDLSVTSDVGNFALRFTGYINITTGGTYTFYTESNDGSRLYIGDMLIVDNDGFNARPESSGSINLKAGRHRITVTYIEFQIPPLWSPGKNLYVKYSGPDTSGSKVSIPNGVLYRDDPGASPLPDPYSQETRVSVTPRLGWEGLFAEALWDDAQAGIHTEYDAMGRVWKVTPAGDEDGSRTGPSTTAYCDGTDPWAQISTDAEGKVTKKYFDAAGRVKQIVEVASTGDISTYYRYDRLGRLIKTIDNSGNQFQAEYDSLDRKIRSIDPDMGTWTYAYDDAGRMVEQEDARNNRIQFSYDDEIGRVSQKRTYDHLGQLAETITYTYDASDDPDYTVHKGQLYKVTDSQGWTKTGYDSQGRAIKSSRYVAATDHTYTTQTAYDLADRVTQITYPDTKAVIGYRYDEVGHLIKVESLWGTGADEVFYEACGFNAMHQETTVVFGNGRSTQYEYYDHTRRLKRMTTGGESTIQDIRYTYDRASNILSVTDAVHTLDQSCGLSDIVYDDLYRLSSLTSVADGDLAYEYDALGNIHKNGEMGTGAYAYAGSGHAHSQPHAVTSANGSTYTYDACGNMTTRSRSGQPNQTLTYDEQNRLTQVAIAGGNTIQFGYSAGGSRLWKKVNGQVTGLWIGNLYEEKDGKILCHVYAGDRLVATFEPESYIACLIQHHPYFAALWNFGDGVLTALFGGGRAPMTIMCMAALTGIALGLRYNRRRLLDRHGLQTYYGLRLIGGTDPWRQMVLLTMAASVFLSSNPHAAYAGTAVYNPVFYYYHPDHLGSSQLMTDRDGDVVQQYGYTPFGKENYKNNTLAFSVSNRYTGQTLDEDTGLYYYGARYYDPELARFIQADSTIPDPEFSQTYNRYAYVYNNPLKFTDPTGQNPFAIVLFTIGTADVTVGTVVVAACISAGITALAGGNPMKGFALGVTGGMLGGCFGAIANSAFIGAVAAGALTGVMSGGDPLMGAITAGVSAGISAAFHDIPVPSSITSEAEAYLWQLTMSTAAGALAGGVSAEISGGSFGEGAGWGAASAAASYVVWSALEGTPTEGDPQGDSPLPVAAPDIWPVAYTTELTQPVMSGNCWIGGGPVPDACTYSSADEGLYMTALFQEQGNITFVARKPVASLAKQILHNGGKQAFKSAKAFKRYYGSAGEGMNWHHIVEHTGKNVYNFGMEALHNANNIVKIPANIHAKISAHYSSRLNWMPKGMTVRSWLNKLPMDKQYEYGVQIMRHYGIGM